MVQTVLPFLAVLLVGVGIAIETPTNAFLGKSSGSVLIASLISFVVGTAVLGAAALVRRPQLSPGWLGQTPWWAWTGGLYGAFVVLASAWATPKLGAGTTLVVIVASQVAVGVVLDHFGLLGLKPHAVSWLRVAGVMVVAAGALMVSLG